VCSSDLLENVFIAPSLESNAPKFTTGRAKKSI